MKVIGISGSERKGFSTDQLVNKILQGAEIQGAEIKFYNLSKMNISPCKGCLLCRKKEGECSIKDDMDELRAEINSSNAVVIGSPLYMIQMNAQTKTFIDRLFPILKADFTSTLQNGTKAVFAFTQGTENTDAFRNYFEHNENMMKHFGFDVLKTIVAGNTRAKGDLEQQHEKIEEAIKLGNDLISKK